MAKTPYSCIKHFIESDYTKQLEGRAKNAINLTKEIIDTFELDRTQPKYGKGRNAQQVYRYKETGMSNKSYKTYYEAYLKYVQPDFQPRKLIDNNTTNIGNIDLSNYIHKDELEAKFFEWAKNFVSETKEKNIKEIINEIPPMDDIEFKAKALLGEIKENSSEILKLIFKTCYEGHPNTTKSFQSFGIEIRQDLNMVILTMNEIKLFNRNHVANKAGAYHNKVNKEHLLGTVFENNMTKFNAYYKQYVELGKILFKDKKRLQYFIYYITH